MNHRDSEFPGGVIGGHRDQSLAQEGKSICRLRTLFYCAEWRPRFHAAKTLT